MGNSPRFFIAILTALAIGLFYTGCKKDEENPADPGLGGGGGISSTAFPNNTASVTTGGGPVQGTLTGGTPPYSITQQPNAAVATAELSGTDMETLTITPVAAGSTSVTIQDNAPIMGDSPAGNVTIAINVTEGGGASGYAGTGTIALTTSAGDFTATGTYNPNMTSGQMVGGAHYMIDVGGTMYDVLDIVGINARSVSDADIAFVTFTNPGGTLAAGEYMFIPMGGPYADLAFGFGINLQNPTDIFIMTSGDVTLTSIEATAAAGNQIDGGGINFTTQAPVTVETGSFSGEGFGTTQPRPQPRNEIEAAVHRILDEMRAQRIKELSNR